MEHILKLTKGVFDMLLYRSHLILCIKPPVPYFPSRTSWHPPLLSLDSEKAENTGRLPAVGRQDQYVGSGPQTPLSGCPSGSPSGVWFSHSPLSSRSLSFRSQSVPILESPASFIRERKLHKMFLHRILKFTAGGIFLIAIPALGRTTRKIRQVQLRPLECMPRRVVCHPHPCPVPAGAFGRRQGRSNGIPSVPGWLQILISCRKVRNS